MKSFSTIIVIGFTLIAQQTNAKDTTTHGLRTQHNKRLNIKHKQTNDDIDIIAKEDVAFFTRTLQGSLPPTPTPGPVANPDFASLSAGGFIFVSVLDNDIPAPGETLRLDSILPPDQGGPDNGNCAVVGNSVEYIPRPGFTGTDSCVYFACATTSSCVTAPVTFTVTPVPITAPVRSAGLDGEVDEVQQAYGSIVPNRSNGPRSSGKSGKGSGKSGKASSGKSSKGSKSSKSSSKSSKGSSGSGGYSRR